MYRRTRDGSVTRPRVLATQNDRTRRVGITRRRRPARLGMLAPPARRICDHLEIHAHSAERGDAHHCLPRRFDPMPLLPAANTQPSRDGSGTRRMFATSRALTFVALRAKSVWCVRASLGPLSMGASTRGLRIVFPSTRGRDSTPLRSTSIAQSTSAHRCTVRRRVPRSGGRRVGGVLRRRGLSTPLRAAERTSASSARQLALQETAPRRDPVYSIRCSRLVLEALGPAPQRPAYRYCLVGRQCEICSSRFCRISPAGHPEALAPRRPPLPGVSRLPKARRFCISCGENALTSRLLRQGDVRRGYGEENDSAARPRTLAQLAVRRRLRRASRRLLFLAQVIVPAARTSRSHRALSRYSDDRRFIMPIRSARCASASQTARLRPLPPARHTCSRARMSDPAFEFTETLHAECCARSVEPCIATRSPRRSGWGRRVLDGRSRRRLRSALLMQRARSVRTDISRVFAHATRATRHATACASTCPARHSIICLTPRSI